VSEADLLSTAETFADRQKAFQASIAPAALGRFLAFRLQDGEETMRALHADCVRAFEPCRAPLSKEDIARRRQAQLTPAQDLRLVTWGYPYIFEDFRFHMTLTSSIANDAKRVMVLAALAEHFEAETGPHVFDAIAVFRQPDRSQPFQILRRLDFPAPVPATV
jgi:hypothetical protein